MWFVKYLGIPFVELGRDRSGWDCWGLVRTVYAEELGILLPEWSSHKSSFDNAEIEREIQDAHAYFSKIPQPEPMSIAWFSSRSIYAHVGIVIDAQRMLHCTAGKDTCVESWQPRLHQLKGFYVPNDQNHRPA
jgi:cell wall-associated NlpC family hydrolase